MNKIAKLICVTDINNNKFYNMEQISDIEFCATWGRVESYNTQTKNYPLSKWDTIYRSKIKKGYSDITHLYNIDEIKIDFIKINNKSIDDILKRLYSFANKVVCDNYSISSSLVTSKMIDEAQIKINNLLKLFEDYKEKFQLTTINDYKQSFNNILLDLFKILPRKMKKVQDYLVDDTYNISKLEKLILKEQDMLDSMMSIVSMQNNKEIEPKIQSISLLDKLGIEMKEKDQRLEDEVKEALGSELKNKYVNCWYVVNTKTQEIFNKHLNESNDKKTRIYWHGSRNANWISILENGLKIRPSNAVYTGSMFGDGIYFAPKAMKSFGYTSSSNAYWTKGNSNTAIMALFKVHVGKRYHINEHTSECSKLTKQKLINKGNYDSTYAHAGKDLRNDEIIIYDSNQATIYALVELKG